MLKRGLPRCSLQGPYFYTMGILVSVPMLLFSLISLIKLLRSGSGVMPWGARVEHPIVFFPGYSTSRLKVTVTNQNFSSTCPANASFEFFSGHVIPWAFSERCVLESLRVVDTGEGGVCGGVWDLTHRFRSPAGVTVELADFGSPQCAPIYFPLYLRLIAAGYSVGFDLFSACYDFRMAPNVDVTPGHTFFNASRHLIETAYANGGNRRVYLLAHSNGGPMAQALLLSQPQEWRDKYVAGLVAYAGNWAGQGSFAQFLFTGVSFTDYSTWRPEAAEVLQTWPAVYFSMAQPEVFGNSEVIIAAGNKSYTPGDYDEMFADAKMTQPAVLFRLFNGVVKPSQAPHVNVFSFYGSKLKTQVGSELPELKTGVIPTGKIYLEGDGDQESADNESNFVWKELMTCHRFEAIELAGTSHLLVPFTLQSMRKTLQIVQRDRVGSCTKEEGQSGVRVGAAVQRAVEGLVRRGWERMGRRGGRGLNQEEEADEMELVELANSGG